MSKKSDLKRGDLVKTTGGVIGRVLGWIDDVTLCVQDLEDETNIVSDWYEDTTLLSRFEDLQSLASLPKEIKLKDTYPGE